MSGDFASRIAKRFPSRFLRAYVRSKLQTDPLYDAVAERLSGHTLPVIDIGCGVGLTSFSLRERGFLPIVTGFDHDGRKVDVARAVAAHYENLTFFQGDALELPGVTGSFLLLDLLHYFEDADQQRLLAAIAERVPPGGVVMIRDGVADGSWRYRVTYCMEQFARAVRWLRADRLNFPTRERIIAAFPRFAVEVVPLWGATPFNNYLFVFRRSGEGTTNE